MRIISLLIILTIFLFVYINDTQAQCHIDDWTALKALYDKTNGDNWNNNNGWDVEIGSHKNWPSVCNLGNLYGLEIAFGRVKSVNLPGNNLEGSIPGEIEKMVNLEHLTLRGNKLNGSIPSSIGNLIKLKDLILNGNKLIGSIPSSIGNLNSLTQMYLNHNQLSGTIPLSIGNLTNLKWLGLNNNQLSGNIPTEIGYLSSLKELWLQGNNLSGGFPAEIGGLSNLNILSLSPNKLHGCFPDNLAILCSQITDARFNAHNNIDNNNVFDARWDDFCTNGAGSCELQVIDERIVSTNYSGGVNIETTTANILRNNYATIYDHCTSNCDELKIIEACNRVSGFNNLSANEALWAASNAASFITPYFLSYQNAELAPVNIITNYTCDMRESIFRPSTNTIILGKGDGIERNSMTAPDIVAHEYAHYILNIIENLDLINYGIPGAISESFADIFAEVIEYYSYGENDWIFGEQVVTIAPYKGIRSLKQPKDSQMKYKLPHTYKGEYWIDTEDVCFHNDLCGVHTNCGVHNYWFYLLANGGSGINDNGYAYNINGIGIEKAFDIVFENFSNHLSANISYENVMWGSIQSAKSLFGDVSNEASKVIEAWRAVGLDYTEQNPIQFKLLNVEESGEPILANGKTIIPVKFDLAIDSLGQDLTADNLCFTLQLPEGYLDFELEEIYPPLNVNEINIANGPGEVNICIDRQSATAQNRKKIVETIASQEPIVRGVICIVVIDIGGEENILEPLNISGYTIINSNEVVSFASDDLIFGFDNNNIGLTIDVSHESCNALGAVELVATGNPPFTFYLRNTAGNLIKSSPSVNNITYQFFNLGWGDYEVIVFDNSNSTVSEEFSLNFVADLTGSFCCPENVIIPAGLNNNYFSAVKSISLDNGALITGGSLEICD